MSLGPLMIDLRGTAIAADERAWLTSPLVGGVILFVTKKVVPRDAAAA